MCKFNAVFLGIIYLLSTVVDSKAREDCTECPSLSGLVCINFSCRTVDKGCHWGVTTKIKPVMKRDSLPIYNKDKKTCTYRIEGDMESLSLELLKKP